MPARFITFGAAVAEAQPGLENHAVARGALRRLVSPMDIVGFAPALTEAVFDEVSRWTPRMNAAARILLSTRFPLKASRLTFSSIDCASTFFRRRFFAGSSQCVADAFAAAEAFASISP